jgi:spermidine/putrescine-binding protein
MSAEVLRVLAWPDYAIREVEAQFSKSTGLAIVWDFFDQNEDAFSRCQRDPTHYDVVFADGAWPARYLESDLIRPITTTAMVGWPDVHPAIRHWCSQNWSKPDGSLSAYPCFWGIRGIIYDPLYVEPPTSWRHLSSAPPGTLWLNSQGSELIAEIALGMGTDPARVYAMGADELGRVDAVLLKLTACMGGIWRLLPELEVAFTRGTACVAEVHTTCLLDNVERASGRQLKVAVPEEGTVAYLDGAMLGVASRFPEAAVRFIEILTSPAGVVAQWRESDGYPCASATALERVRTQPEWRSKLDRSGATIDALEQSVMYAPPINVDQYLEVWRAFLARLDVPIPFSVRSAMGLPA